MSSAMSNISGEGGSFSSGNNTGEELEQYHHQQSFHVSNPQPVSAISNGSTSQPISTTTVKKKRNLPGTPDPTAEVIALSPTTLMATNRFICEICSKGFQRDQNLQLHRRGHNLPWKLRQRTTAEIRKRVYICPESTCVHHNPSRALGDLTGIKKHFCRKHGEKKWKCDKCSKKYAVQSDWKAHSKTCGTREYKCDCGTIFSRRDSFITHRAFCDALAEENNKVNHGLMGMAGNLQGQVSELISSIGGSTPIPVNTNPMMGISDFNQDTKTPLKCLSHDLMPMPLKSLNMAGGMFSGTPTSLFGSRTISSSSSSSSSSTCLHLTSNNSSTFEGLIDAKNGRQIAVSVHMSATALLQKAAQMGATVSSAINPPMLQRSFMSGMAGSDNLSSLRPYGGIQQTSPYDQLHSHTDQSQSQLVGVDGSFTTHFLQKHQTEYFDSPAESSVMNDMGIFPAVGMFAGGGDQHGFLKNMENHNSNSNNNINIDNNNNMLVNQGVISRQNSGLVMPVSDRDPAAARYGGGFLGEKVGDKMTVDFLGVGGATRSVNLHEQQQLQNPFQQLSHGQGSMEKPMWDV